MRRSLALAAAAGILLGGCTADNDPEGIRASTGRRPTAIEILQADVGRDIISRLGSAGLILVLDKHEGRSDMTSPSISLVVTRDTICASEFSFAKNAVKGNIVDVRLELFGNYSDLIDTRQLEDSAMYNGTIGHGDNVGSTVINYLPHNPVSHQATVDFMLRTTEEACSIINQPIAIG